MSQEKKCIIKGKVYDSQNQSYANVDIKVFEYTFGDAQEIVLSPLIKTAADGSYEITINESDLSRQSLAFADITITASINSDTVSSSALTNLPSQMTLDFSFSTDNEKLGQTEYENIAAAFGAVDLSSKRNQMSQADRAYTADKAKVSANALNSFVNAQDFTDKQAVYAFLRQLNGKSLSSIYHMSTNALKALLQTAYDRHLIDDSYTATNAAEGAINKIIDTLTIGLSTGEIFTKLFTQLNIDSTKQAQFIDLYKANRTNYDDFITAMDASVDFGVTFRENMEHISQLFNIFDNKEAVITAYQSSHSTKNIWELNRTDFQGLLNGETSSFDTEDAFLDAIQDRVEQFHSTKLLQAQVDDNDLKASLDKLNTSENFQIGQEAFITHLENNPEAALTATDRDNIKRLERLYKLSPRMRKVEIVNKLIKAEIHSAIDIADKGLKKFTDKYLAECETETQAKLIYAEAQAKQIYERAQAIVGKAIMVYAAKSANFNNLLPAMLTGSLENQADGIPTIEELFGSQDYCDCKHCQSMYSPAAYLADLIKFSSNIIDPDDDAIAPISEIILGEIDGDAITTLGRRSDIGFIELSCENSNTVIPYIDLVNEVLETAIEEIVYPEIDNDESYKRQTSWTEAELNANPEHLNTKVYDNVLNSKLYPWGLPYELSHNEARIYSEHLGTSLAEIEGLFGTEIETETATGSDTLQAAESIGMTPLELAIITKKFTGNFSLQDLTGVAYTYASLDVFVGICYNAEASFLISGAAGTAKKLIDLAGIDLETLQSLTSCKFIFENPAVISFADDSCDLSTATIQMSTDELDRMHRFLRLQRKLGWDIRALDSVLRHKFDGIILDNLDTDIDNDLIIELSALEKLRSTYNIEIQELLSWKYNIDTYEYETDKSYYKSQFINKSVNDPIAPLQTIFELNTGLTSFLHYNGLTDHIDQEVSFSVGSIDYKYLPEYLMSITGLKKEDVAFIITNETDLKLTISDVSKVFRIASFSKALKISVQEYYLYKEVCVVNNLVSFEDFEAFAMDIETIKASAFDIEMLGYLINDNNNAYKVSGEESNSFLIGLKDFLSETNNTPKSTFIKTFVAEQLNVDSLMAEALLKELSVNSTSLMDLFEGTDLLDPTVTTGVDGNNVYTFTDDLNKCFPLLYKAELLSNKWKLLPEEVFVISKDTLVDLNNAFNTIPDFKQWRISNDFVAIKSHAIRPDRSILELINDPVDFTNSIAELSIFDSENVNAIFTNVSEVDLTEEDKVEKIITQFQQLKLSHTTEVSTAQLSSWAGFKFDFEKAKQIKNVAKSKYSYNRWLEIAPAIRDVLREQQRDALLTYLIANDVNFEDAFDVYSYYLIDPAMAACGRTTRIKQAISAMQMLINRTQINLESPYVLDDDQVEEWKWRKLYRVWEANRKVFLYPENWIEPELRDSKTNFFEELESELLQNNLTERTAEEVYLSYLEKLDDVANLEVTQFYEEEHESDPTRNIFHVFARTKSHPHQYYYRQFNRLSGWTGWSAIELEIQGEHIVPYVYNSRLFLFWAEFGQTAEGGDPIPLDTTEDTIESDAIDVKYTIHLNWSQLKNGTWLPQKRSKAFMTLENFAKKPSQVFFKAFTDSFEDMVVMPITQETIGLKPLANANTDVTYIKTSKGLIASTKVYDVDDAHLGAVGNAFVFSGCNEDPRIDTRIGWHKNPAFIDTHWDNMKFVRESAGMEMPIYSQQSTDTVLASGLNPMHKLTFSHHYGKFLDDEYFFYEDRKRVFFVHRYTTKVKKNLTYMAAADISASSSGVVFLKSYPAQNESYANNAPNAQASSGVPNVPATNYNYLSKYSFRSFYHPYICLMVKQLRKGGINALLDPATNGTEDDSRMLLQRAFYKFFNADYSPTDLVDTVNPYNSSDTDFPEDAFDFDPHSAYAVYNWELFFHIPMMIASALHRNKQYEAAQRWYHFVFDPTESKNGQTSDNYNGALYEGDSIRHKWRIKPFNQLAENIDSATSITSYLSSDESISAVNNWENDPFDPHTIAVGRPLAYMKNVVMRYIDNLFEWADMLFSRDSIESINEATQLYVLAAQILGRKPESTLKEITDIKNIHEISLLDVVPTGISELTGALPDDSTTSLMSINATGFLPGYFGIPKNDQLLGYWDKVYDRLFKIRHCMNIKGVVRQLPIFQAPIDPGMLVKAAAAGIDIAQAVSDLSAPAPSYRFQYLISKATEFTADVRALGGAMLSALEKKDAEEMAILRNTHENSIQDAMVFIREQSVEDAKTNLEALDVSKSMIETRIKFYNERPNTIREENEHVEGLKDSRRYTMSSQAFSLLGAALAPIPTIKTGVTGPFPLFQADIVSGATLSRTVSFSGQLLNSFATEESLRANISSIQGSFARRNAEWENQKATAQLELEQIEKQIISSEIRLAMAEKELGNLKLQIAQTKETRAFLEGKFSNKKLYGWMSGQLSTLYASAYKLAKKIAKQAQKAYQLELDTNDIYIREDSWDSLKKGLLAGEKLQHDLRLLEEAYMNDNARRYELTKHISLAQLAPEHLMSLRKSGMADLQIGEWIYDLDYPEMTDRRIKSVSVSIPCITGPLNTIPCKVSLTGNETASMAAVDTMATSTAQQDTGLFELNFNDVRYLPFEGAYAWGGTWTFKLPEHYRSFDYNSISDLILTIRYTAIDGNESDGLGRIEEATENLLANHGNGDEAIVVSQIIDVKALFPNEYFEWENGNQININLPKSVLPFYMQDKNITVNNVNVVTQGESTGNSTIELGTGYNAEILDPANVDGYDYGFKAEYVDTLGDFTNGIDIKIGVLANFNHKDGLYLIMNYNIVTPTL